MLVKRAAAGSVDAKADKQMVTNKLKPENMLIGDVYSGKLQLL